MSVDIKNLEFGYGDAALFRGLDLTFAPGNIYGLLGLNGAGKTTLLKLMTGLLFPDRGVLTALGQAPATRNPSFLSKVFVLPEELNLPGVTGEEYVRGLAPFYPAFDHERFELYSREFDLPRRTKLTSHSYGQKKKFLLSFGLASQSALLLLDEPTNGLDIPSKGLFRRLVAEAASDQRVFVISTHQVKDVESLIDPIVVIHEGRVLFNQSMTAITRRIRMGHAASRPDASDPALVYSEPAVGGYWSVWAQGDEDGRIDLEVLFNSIVARAERYGMLFDNKEMAA